MRNNLLNVEKNLRSIAKRYKSVKYSIGLAILFLMMGVNAFSEEITTVDNAVANQTVMTRAEIKSTAAKLQERLNELKKQNQDVTKGAKLELIQLMEQGNQVVKSPWSSWQFGANFFYDNWGSSYKGRGDKAEKYGDAQQFVREEGKISRATGHTSSKHYNELEKGNNKKYASTNLRGGSTGYGIASNKTVREPIVSLDAAVVVKPKEVVKNKIDPAIPHIDDPKAQLPSIKIVSPELVEDPKVVLPEKPTITVQPNTNPFFDYSFQSKSLYSQYADATGGMVMNGTSPFIITNEGEGKEEQKVTDAGNKIFWAGLKPDGTFENASGVIETNGTETKFGEPRPGVITYLTSQHTPNNYSTFKNAKIYIQGSNTEKSVNDHIGQLGYHTVGNMTFENVHGYLGGKAAFISLETWWAGKLTLNNVTANILEKGDENTLFYIYPTDYNTIFGYEPAKPGARGQRGGFIGEFNADLLSNKNIGYLVMGAQGSFNISNSGTYRISGSNNILYSGQGYVADFDNFKTTGSINERINTYTAEEKEALLKPGTFTPAIRIQNPAEVYGDKNVLLYFSHRFDIKNPTGDNKSNSWSMGGGGVAEKSGIGIYQGEIQLKADIGSHLSLVKNGDTNTPDDTQQSDKGNAENGDKKYSEGNIAILGWSGQRGAEKVGNNTAKILPDQDFGAKTSLTSNVELTKDPIHSLQVNDLDVTFGKYSKGGVIAVAEKGTVIDIKKSSNFHKDNDGLVPINTTTLKDYKGDRVKVSDSDTENEAATGTIIAYANGTWKSSEFAPDFLDELGSENPGKRLSKDAERFEGKGSEVNIGSDVELSARFKEGSTPIAYYAKDKGQITVEGNTDIKGYKSIGALAEAGAKVYTGYKHTYEDDKTSDIGRVRAENLEAITGKGNITAIDEWADKTDENTKELLNQNIGAYALGQGSEVNVNGNLKVNGIGAVAADHATVNVKGTGSIIKSGKETALFAKNSGVINFAGGTIDLEEDKVLNNTIPFYSTSDSGQANGQIKFTGPTTINMYKGILVDNKSTENDYKDTVDNTSKFQGMRNVTINFKANGVNLGIFSGVNPTWDGTDTFLENIKTTRKFGAINTNGHTYKTTLRNSTLNVTQNAIDLNDATNSYNSIVMENTKVTIDANTTIRGEAPYATLGKDEQGVQRYAQGLSMASNTQAIDNTTTGYVNKGTVNITGGTADSGIAAMNVSYGTIVNEAGATVTVDNGAALYGSNGSKIKNTETITVGGSGAGIVGVAKGDKPTGYGFDKDNTKQAVDIENSGTITVNGAKPIGIYALNNGAVAPTKVTVKNTGKIIALGDNATGILVKGAPIPATPAVQENGSENGGTVTLSGTGSSDIVVGKNGIGVFAQNSDVTLESKYGVEVKDGGTGIFVKGNSSIVGNNPFELKYSGTSQGTAVGLAYGYANATNNMAVNILNGDNTAGITNIFANGGGTFTNTATAKLTTVAKSGIAILSKNNTNVVNSGEITVKEAASSMVPNIGIYTDGGTATITNDAKVTVGNNSIGLFGNRVDLNSNTDLNLGTNTIGVYSKNGDVKLSTGGKLTVGRDQSVGIYTIGGHQNITAEAGSTISVGDNSFAFVNIGTGNTITTNNVGPVTLGNDAMYIYSNDTTGTVNNHTKLTATGDKNYGLYSAGTIHNYADIDFSQGIGNVAIYTNKGGTAINHSGATLSVGESDNSNKLYSIGMAGGYEPSEIEKAAGKVSDTGSVINEGTIKVNGKFSTGLYASGQNSKAENKGRIVLSADNDIGIFVENKAKAINSGTIETSGTGLKNVKGVVIGKGSELTNESTGKIIIDSSNGAGVFLKGGTVKNYGLIRVNGNQITNTSETTNEELIYDTSKQPVGKELGSVKIDAKAGDKVAKILVNGKEIPLAKKANNRLTEDENNIPEVIRTINAVEPLKHYNPEKTVDVDSIGMYINTSGIDFTKPIENVGVLTEKADLIIGNEAAERTNSKYIVVSDKKILDPYSKSIANNPQVTKWNIYSGSYTWMSTVTRDPDTGDLTNIYLAKIPYTEYAGNEDTPVEKKDTYNFLDGLEQRYGVEALGTRERELFTKLNSIGNNEEILFNQATDEMMGHQYANVQQRVYQTGSILDKEFSYLKKEWQTFSKDSNKVKVFGAKGQYKTDTAGVIDTTNHGYGVAYLHEDETVRLGKSLGWYAGIVENRLKFEDLGNSKENMLQGKLGVFKSIPFDYNNSLNLTLSGELSAGYNKMHRRFLVVDDIFNAKARYHTYGAGIKGELSKEFRLSEDFKLRPYASLKYEYGRIGKIREKSGEIRLEVKSNSYHSVKPEIGTELEFKHDFGAYRTFRTTLGIAYENELGRVANGKNKARVADTQADWFNIRGEKEDRRGNVKSDLKIGIDNSRVGITLGVGYDTKGNNLRGGLGLRIIY